MSVLEALARHYERLHARGEAPPYGFSRERIAYAIVLSDAGEAVALSPLPERSGNAPGPTSCEVPHAVSRTSRPVANFLWDKIAYVLGAKRDAMTRKACPAHREHHAFQALHETLLSGTDDDGLQALLRFLRAWDASEYGALPHAEAMLGSRMSSSDSRANGTGSTSAPRRGRCGRATWPARGPRKACVSSPRREPRSRSCIPRSRESGGPTPLRNVA